jgi:PhzF family phenazine biosynthesis protein
MPTPLLVIDAFADRPFHGNPAAVVVLESEPDGGWMQRVADEMNQSETAFVWPAEREGEWALRWFTPVAEVELCGHATLASAHALWQLQRTPEGAPTRFHTRVSGVLTCSRDPDTAMIAMDFPADRATPAAPPAGLAEALGVSPVRVSRSTWDWIVELATPGEVRQATPDFAGLARFDARGIALTAAGSDDDRESASDHHGPTGPDIVSRFFAPRHRINEDPVTGSLHCTLGPYWFPRLGKRTLVCEQASRRGGTLLVTPRGDRVTLAGHAHTTAEGNLLV